MTTILTTNLDLDGSVSTADRYSNIVDLTRRSTSKLAFIIKVGTVTDGKIAVRLQGNMDSDGASEIGWFDIRSTSVRLSNALTGAALDQTDADFTVTVAGIITATGNYFMEIVPSNIRYRLAYSVEDSSTDVTIDYSIAS
jgi:hypothetical protein